MSLKETDALEVALEKIQTGYCDIGNCGEEARTIYRHPQPQRGIVAVCDTHLRRLMDLPGEVEDAGGMG